LRAEKERSVHEPVILALFFSHLYTLMKKCGLGANVRFHVARFSQVSAFETDDRQGEDHSPVFSLSSTPGNEAHTFG
jgi:hypothetical protein